MGGGLGEGGAMAAARGVVSGLGWLVLFAIRMLGRCWSSCHQELGEERSVGTCGLWRQRSLLLELLCSF